MYDNGSENAYIAEKGFSCTDGDIRLEGGRNEFGGRVEICRNNSFGSICDNGLWNDPEAKVVCNKLGFEGICHEPSVCM